MRKLIEACLMLLHVMHVHTTRSLIFSLYVTGAFKKFVEGEDSC